jgi:hypothetical protein
MKLIGLVIVFISVVSVSTFAWAPKLGIFDSGGQTVELPRDVKDAVTSCRKAVQEALTKRVSRMSVDFPVGTKFGVEITPKKQRRSDTPSTPTLVDLQRSDRELARLFVDMFQPVGGDNIATCFADETTADAAKQAWKGDATASCRILSMDGRKAKKIKKNARGFAAKMSLEMDDEADTSGPFQLPKNCEVALFVAPGPKELLVIERICETAGMGTLVILLNARLWSIDKFATLTAKQLFLTDFQSVFCLTAAPQKEAPGCLLYRTFPFDWVLARKPSVGKPKTLLNYSERPTLEECKSAYDAIQVSELEKGFENIAENIATWLK